MEYVTAIRSALEPLVLDQMEELVFDTDLVQDATLARTLLPRMPRLRRLDLDGITYAQECHKVILGRHAMHNPRGASLVALDLSGCLRVSSRMVHELLMTCAGLVAFAAPWLKASSMVSDASEVSSSSCLVPLPAPVPPHLLLEPWVCRNLERLQISLKSLGLMDESLGSTGAANQIVYAQLARLTRLRWVSLSEKSGDGYVFRMTRQGGLEQLDGWTRMRELDVRELGWFLDVEDVKWMVGRWPELEKVRVGGYEDGDEATLSAIRGYLDELWWQQRRRVLFVTNGKLLKRRNGFE